MVGGQERIIHQTMKVVVCVALEVLGVLMSLHLQLVIFFCLSPEAKMLMDAMVAQAVHDGERCDVDFEVVCALGSPHVDRQWAR